MIDICIQLIQLPNWGSLHVSSQVGKSPEEVHVRSLLVKNWFQRHRKSTAFSVPTSTRLMIKEDRSYIDTYDVHRNKSSKSCKSLRQAMTSIGNVSPTARTRHMGPSHSDPRYFNTRSTRSTRSSSSRSSEAPQFQAQNALQFSCLF